ncbi:MAG: glutamate synthase central domain-containing protein, partial [Chloroflexota bacterium]
MAARPSTPLYDPRFEHDACGIGFVADAGGRSRDRVLGLALAGLASLGHRGAFAADGESSDGAGISLPLSRDVIELLAPGLGAARPAIVQLFLPRGRVRRERARTLVAEAVASVGLAVERWRRVPHDPSALGAEARAAMPRFEQAVVLRPADCSEAAFEGRLVLARRRLETAARGAELELSVPSASARTIVYKGLVAGGRLAQLFPDLAAPLNVPYALFHQRYATNTHPVWRLAQPFRSIAHNGEINTVRGNREQVRGRARDAGGRPRAREVLGAGPALSPDGSDSLSLDESLELLTLSGWDLPTALLASIPEALAVRLAPHPQVASLQRRTAGFLAPWDGPAAIVFGDGRRVGALTDRNGLRPVAFAVTRDRLVAVASEAGAIPITAAETVRRGRLGPGQMLLVDPVRHAVLEDADAKATVLAGLPIHDEPHPAYQDRANVQVTTTPVPLRYLAGLDAERGRLDIKTMALESHEPLWSMGDDTPTPGRGRLDRRAVDHIRQAFAQVTNPPIDPERERVVMDLRVEVGRRPPLLGGLPAGPRTIRLDRPLVADLGGLLDAFPGPIAHLDATWDPAAGAAGLADALDLLASEAVRAATGSVELLVLSDRAFDFERLPIPSVLAVGAVHAALTDAGLRGRADIVVEAADVLDVHACAMAIACGAAAVHPWLAIELASELAGSRGAEELTPDATIGNLLAAFEAGLRKTLARMGISAISSYVGGALFDTVELDPSVVARCFPAAAAGAGGVARAAQARRP